MTTNLVAATQTQLSAAAPNWLAMKSAIEQCARIDEVREVSDKLLAIRVYYAQSNDTENETEAVRIRTRAERRLGELLKAGRIDGTIAGEGRPSKLSTATIVSDLGISNDRSARAQKLAEIPEAEFEQAMSTGRPSLRSMTRPQVDRSQVDRVLKTWGMIRDFAAAVSEQKLFDPEGWKSQGGIQPFQVQEIQEAIPHIIKYLTQLVSEK